MWQTSRIQCERKIYNNVFSLIVSSRYQNIITKYIYSWKRLVVLYLLPLYWIISASFVLKYRMRFLENASLNTKLTAIPELHYHTEAVLCNNFAAECRSSLKLYNILNGAKSWKLREILALYEIVERDGSELCARK